MHISLLPAIDFYRDVPRGRGRSTLEVLQLSVQQEGEADMDVELLRKGMMAVKLRVDGTNGSKARQGARGRGGAEGEEDMSPSGLMPGAVCCSSEPTLAQLRSLVS